ncbi:tRNA lysidine(34) synthetase TilS [uncultured Duncaniella sp.]|uniref:tRNA lysidine(34) synthetase TilS n=2 Tax=uncultured Duncaniella sp. TaxID=2768039 RepID=UPI0025FC48EE|nr:tRNA lysidine(34) synthetase TilS [uncultured Duncaniella sp.]
MTSLFGKKVRDFIEGNHLVGKTDRIVVGLSGGADSVALLLVLRELGYDCVAAHCNFHLRGEESMRDERFCRDLCAGLGIEFIMQDFDVAQSRELTGESVEMACRRLRYDWWDSLLREGVGHVLAVGHHREDNVETFFLNLLRGSGLAGLKAMMPRNVNTIRPLLDSTKAEIIDYLDSQGVKFVTDSSNLSNDYKRNRLRNIVIPELEKIFPGAAETIAASISHLRDNYALYTDYTDELRSKYMDADGSINLSRLVTTEKNSRMVLFELLSKVGMNMTQVDNILATINDNGACPVSGRTFRTTAITYLLDRGKLIPMDDAGDDDFCEKVNLFSAPFSARRLNLDEFELMRKERRLNPHALYLDSRVLDGEPEFELRSWRKGDRLEPFGMKGSKLVSDLLSDAKYSLQQKRSVRLLTRNGQVLWVINLRTSRNFAVDRTSREVLEIIYQSK